MLECCHVIVFTSHCLHTLLLCEFSVGGCVPEWEGDTQCGRVCPRVGECSPVWEGVPQYGRVFPSVGGCAPVYVRCVCVCEVWVSLSHVLMMDTQVHLCVHLIAGRFGHVTKAYVAETFKT